MVKFLKSLFSENKLNSKKVNIAFIHALESVSERFFSNLNNSNLKISDTQPKTYKIYRNFLGKDFFNSEELQELSHTIITTQIIAGPETSPIYTIIITNPEKNKKFSLFSGRCFDKLIFNSNKLVNKKIFENNINFDLLDKEKHFLLINNNEILTATDIHFNAHYTIQKTIKNIKNNYYKEILKLILTKVYCVDLDVIKCVDKMQELEQVKIYTNKLLKQDPNHIERRQIIELLKCN